MQIKNDLLFFLSWNKLQLATKIVPNARVVWFWIIPIFWGLFIQKSKWYIIKNTRVLSISHWWGIFGSDYWLLICSFACLIVLWLRQHHLFICLDMGSSVTWGPSPALGLSLVKGNSDQNPLEYLFNHPSGSGEVISILADQVCLYGTLIRKKLTWNL